jgi:hypothetical protein
MVCMVVVGGDSSVGDGSREGETMFISSVGCLQVRMRCKDRGSAQAAAVRVNVVEEDSDDRAGRSCVYVLQGYRPAKFRSTHLPSGSLFFFCIFLPPSPCFSPHPGSAHLKELVFFLFQKNKIKIY